MNQFAGSASQCSFTPHRVRDLSFGEDMVLEDLLLLFGNKYLGPNSVIFPSL